DGSVYATTVWDPDGAGPQPPLLVMGGVFKVAGSVAASNIVAWDGSVFQALGSGTSGGVSATPGIVQALAVYNGELIAAGDFTSIGGIAANSIARWNGSVWQPLGLGLGGSNPFAFALAVYNGALVAGGRFSSAGGVAVSS